MKVIGIDPGYDRLGVAIIEKDAGKETLLYSDCLLSSPKQSFAGRLLTVADQLEQIITDWQPEAMAIETLFFSKNTKTAIKVAEVRGVISYLAAKHGLKLLEYNPMEIKVCIAGHGGADKSQVTEMTKRLIKIENPPAGGKLLDDEYDAIAIALTYLARNGR